MTEPIAAASVAEVRPLDELDRLLREIVDLADTLPAPDTFYAGILRRVVSSLGAQGGALWTVDAAAQLRLEGELNGDGANALAVASWPAEFVAKAIAAGRAALLPPRATSTGDGAPRNPTPLPLLLAPWSLESGGGGLLAVVLRDAPSPAAERGYLSLLTAIAAEAARYANALRLRTLEHRIERFDDFERFLKRIHGSLDVAVVAYRIVNEARRFIGCDRVSVAVRRGRRFRVLAVSGADHVYRRADTIRAMQGLAEAVARDGEAVAPSAQRGDLPPQVEMPLQAYLDVAHPRDVHALPLCVPNERAGATTIVGVFVVEDFQRDLAEGQRVRAEVVAAHSALALDNALTLRSIPGVRLLGGVGRGLKAIGLTWLTLLLLIVLAAALALTFVPADFTVKARGALQPQVRREIFAPHDGVIYRVCVRHGESVAAGQTLVELRSPELDLEALRVRGERQTARKRLAAVEAERLQLSRRATTPDAQHRLTAEEEELRELIKGLDEQLALLDEQQQALAIRSPLDAVVLTWDLEALLAARPVSRGQVLMTVGRLDGPWHAELRVPEADSGRVVAAAATGDVPVTFVLATEPGVTHRGVVRHVAVRTEIDDDGTAFLPVTVGLDEPLGEPPAPGAAVVARVSCGRRAVGYVWFHDLIDAIRTALFF